MFFTSKLSYFSLPVLSYLLIEAIFHILLSILFFRLDIFVIYFCTVVYLPCIFLKVSISANFVFSMLAAVCAFSVSDFSVFLLSSYLSTLSLQYYQQLRFFFFISRYFLFVYLHVFYAFLLMLFFFCLLIYHIHDYNVSYSLSLPDVVPTLSSLTISL